MKEIVIKEIKLDFEALEAWKDPDHDNMPVTSFPALYRACGAIDAIKEYMVDHPDYHLYHFDNILCNVNTLRKLRDLIFDTWECYSITIDGDNHPAWDTTKYAAGEKHYAKKPTAIVRNSVNADFATYCPGLDDSLPEDVMVIKDFIEEGPEDPIEAEAVDKA